MDPPAKRQRTSKYDAPPRSSRYNSYQYRDATPATGGTASKDLSSPQEALLAREQRNNKKAMDSKHHLLHRRQTIAAPDLTVTAPSVSVAVKFHINAVDNGNSTGSAISPSESSSPSPPGKPTATPEPAPRIEQSVTPDSSLTALSAVTTSNNPSSTAGAVVGINESSQVVFLSPSPSTPLSATPTAIPDTSASVQSSRTDSRVSASATPGSSGSSVSSAPTLSSSSSNAPTSGSPISSSASLRSPTPVVISAPGHPRVTVSPVYFTYGNLTVAAYTYSDSSTGFTSFTTLSPSGSEGLPEATTFSTLFGSATPSDDASDASSPTTSATDSNGAPSTTSGSGAPGAAGGAAGSPTTTGPTTSTTTSAAANTNNDSSPPTPKVVGGVVGGVAGLAVILLVALMLLRWYKRRQRAHQPLSDMSSTGGDGSSHPLTPLGGPGGGMSERSTTPSLGAPLAAGGAAAAFLSRLTGREERAAPGVGVASAPAERGFQKLSGRKLPSAFSEGMTASAAKELGAGASGAAVVRAGAAAAGRSGSSADSPRSSDRVLAKDSSIGPNSSFYRDSTGYWGGAGTAFTGATSSVAPSAMHSASPSYGTVPEVSTTDFGAGTATAGPRNGSGGSGGGGGVGGGGAFEKETLMEGPARTPVLHPGGPYLVGAGPWGVGRPGSGNTLSPPASPDPERFRRSLQSQDGSRGSKFAEDV